jgi:predicted Zn-dependent peptidase
LSLFFTFLPYTYYDKFISVNQTRKGVLNILRANIFIIKLQTKNSQANEAKKIAIQTLNNFINNNIDEQKLQDGKDNIIGGFALQTASNANILTYLSIIGFYNLPLDYLDTFTDKIKNISAQDIQNAFARLINTDKLLYNQPTRVQKFQVAR